MNSDKVESKAKIVCGEVNGEPKTSTKTTKTKDGKMVVEVTTVFVVENPDEIFSLEGSGITMSIETVN